MPRHADSVAGGVTRSCVRAAHHEARADRLRRPRSPPQWPRCWACPRRRRSTSTCASAAALSPSSSSAGSAIRCSANCPACRPGPPAGSPCQLTRLHMAGLRRCSSVGRAAHLQCEVGSGLSPAPSLRARHGRACGLSGPGAFASMPWPAAAQLRSSSCCRHATLYAATPTQRYDVKSRCGGAPRAGAGVRRQAQGTRSPRRRHRRACCTRLTIPVALARAGQHLSRADHVLAGATGARRLRLPLPPAARGISAIPACGWARSLAVSEINELHGGTMGVPLELAARDVQGQLPDEGPPHPRTGAERSRLSRSATNTGVI